MPCWQYRSQLAHESASGAFSGASTVRAGQFPGYTACAAVCDFVLSSTK